MVHKKGKIQNIPLFLTFTQVVFAENRSFQNDFSSNTYLLNPNFRINVGIFGFSFFLYRISRIFALKKIQYKNLPTPTTPLRDVEESLLL
jgi:hypothetical protein